jgi:hypothetical protein
MHDVTSEFAEFSLLALLFVETDAPEEERSTFLRNVLEIIADNTASHSRRKSHICWTWFSW